MMRKSLKTLVAGLLAAFTLASMAEAAPKKAVRRHPRHSARVSSGDPRTTKKGAPVKARRRKARGPSSATPTNATRKTTKPR
jgi:hypothetical protein